MQRFKRRHLSEFANVNDGGGKIRGVQEARPRETPENTQAEPSDYGTSRAAADRWLQNVWPSLRKGYSDEEIYNAHETGVFYKLMPDQSFRLQRHKCTGNIILYINKVMNLLGKCIIFRLS